ncbi:MAG TPA: universal stress protein [Thermoanaerobaculia bacterium]|nr:universal stress protein [Thermoanaerobaculia bacterium]
MYPFRRILIPTDFSTASEWAFDEAVGIATKSGAEILILHIRMTSKSDPSELRFPADPSLYEYAERQELEKLREQLRRAGARIATRMLVKDAPEIGREICRTATDEDADLIVIATHARHHVAHLLIGSTTMSVISDPPRPVLAVRYGTHKREGMRRIIVPVHPRQKSHAALDLALAIARNEHSEIHLLTICSSEERATAEASLAAAEKNAGGIPLKKHIVEGNDIEREIIRFSTRMDADVIFLNAELQIIGDTKIEIIRHAATPVMIVPTEGEP